MNKLLITLLSLFVCTAYAQEYGTGWKSNPSHAKRLKQFVRTGLPASTIVPKTDYEKKLPAIYDQGTQGSCTAQTGVAAFEYQWKLQHGKFLKGSRQGLYVCALIKDGQWPVDAGSYISTITWVLTAQGLGTEACYPYSNKPGKLPNCYLGHAANHKVTESYDIDSTDGESIRIALSNGYLVMFGGYIYSDILSLQAPFILRAPQGRPVGGHAMLIIGHDDKQKLYKVRNSWGPGWGYRGHCFITYKEMHNPKIYEDFAAVKLTN